MKNLTFVAVAFVLLTAGSLAQTGASPEVLLKAAIQKEQVDGDQHAAITQYKTIAENFPAHAVAPEALLRLAALYERLRRPEALGTYQLIVAKYPNSGTIAAKARQRVEALSLAISKFRQTEVPIPPQAIDLGGGVSPNGRYISFVDDTFVANGQGNLGVWTLQTGTSRLVTKSKGWEEGNVRESVWSPDSSTLAYVWWNNTEKLYEVRIASLAGSAPRVLLRDVPGAIPVRVFAWSPDGRTLAAAIARSPEKAQYYRIVLISVADGSLKTLRDLDNVFVPRNGEFSPDGRFLAYDWPADAKSTSRDIFVAGADGRSHLALVSDPASNDEVLGWIPEGPYVLYAADRGGTREARAQLFRPSGAAGDEIVLRQEIGDVSSLGITSDGKLFIQRMVGTPYVGLVPLDPLTGRAVGPAVELTPALPGVWRGQATWSPTGESLAYFQRTSGTAWTLAVHNLASGAVRTYPAPLREPERPVWQPDARAVVFHAFDIATNLGGQYRVDLATGISTRFSNGHSGGFSSDGAFFFHPAPGVIMRRRLSDGSEEVVDRGRHRSMVLSPDGKLLALFDPGTATEGPSIAITPSEGGSRRTIVRNFETESMDNELAWSHDSKFLYFKAGQIWRVAVGGGAPEPVGIKNAGKHLSISPDGRRMAVSSGAPMPEVWIWEHLLFQPRSR